MTNLGVSNIVQQLFLHRVNILATNYQFRFNNAGESI